MRSCHIQNWMRLLNSTPNTDCFNASLAEHQYSKILKLLSHQYITWSATNYYLSLTFQAVKTFIILCSIHRLIVFINMSGQSVIRNKCDESHNLTMKDRFLRSQATSHELWFLLIQVQSFSEWSLKFAHDMLLMKFLQSVSHTVAVTTPKCLVCNTNI